MDLFHTLTLQYSISPSPLLPHPFSLIHLLHPLYNKHYPSTQTPSSFIAHPSLLTPYPHSSFLALILNPSYLIPPQSSLIIHPLTFICHPSCFQKVKYVFLNKFIITVKITLNLCLARFCPKCSQDFCEIPIFGKFAKIYDFMFANLHKCCFATTLLESFIPDNFNVFHKSIL